MKDVQKELYKEILTKGLPISSYLQSVGIDKGQFYKWMKGSSTASPLQKLKMMCLLSALREEAFDTDQMIPILWENNPIACDYLTRVVKND